MSAVPRAAAPDRSLASGAGSGRDGRRDDPLDQLTAREKEVLELMAEGRSNQAIAERLFVTLRAVEKHVTSIFTKLGLPASTDDHRRVLATAIGRLRGKIKYRPVVFELMPPAFTLLQLQRTVEALSGTRLHKQNFRRLVAQQGLVEETEAITSGTTGRPARRHAGTLRNSHVTRPPRAGPGRTAPSPRRSPLPRTSPPWWARSRCRAPTW